MGSCFCQLRVQTHTPQLQQEHVLAELQGLLMWAPAARGCKWAVNPSKSIMYLCPNFNLTLSSLFCFPFIWSISSISFSFFHLLHAKPPECLSDSSKDCPEGHTSLQTPYKVRCHGRDDLQTSLDPDWRHPLKLARDIQVCVHQEIKSQGTGSSCFHDNLYCLIAFSLPHVALAHKSCDLHAVLICLTR